jgi:hypothetical protein
LCFFSSEEGRASDAMAPAPPPLRWAEEEDEEDEGEWCVLNGDAVGEKDLAWDFLALSIIGEPPPVFAVGGTIRVVLAFLVRGERAFLERALAACWVCCWWSWREVLTMCAVAT